MIHLTLDHHDRRPLPFYLAMEEWAATRLPAGEYFFTWVVEPTVIIGRHQDLYTEVNTDYCLQNEIAIYRRKSGGGCVYADTGNVMLSYICADTGAVEDTFARYAALVASALRSLGLDARATGRNDICLMPEGAKVSGNSFSRLPGRSIVHGTLLYDCPSGHMSHAITPSRAKLESKGVKSVQSRVTTIKRHLPNLDLDHLRQAITGSMTTKEMRLDNAAIAEIEGLARPYFDPDWIEGSHLRHGRCTPAASRSQHMTERYIDGIGTIQVHYNTNADGTPADAWLSGDFLDADAIDIRSIIAETLQNIK